MADKPSAKIILDSVSSEGVRLTSFELTFHRFVLAEVNTHRAFSRNSASSRAIPVERQLQRVIEDPAWPIKWPAEQKGMQGGEDLSWADKAAAQALFVDVRENTVRLVQQYLLAHPDKSTRVHKSLINRLLEPFMWHTAIVSATDWNNFLRQRSSYLSPLAQPEFAAVAAQVHELLLSSTPRHLNDRQWHLPYTDQQDVEWERDLGINREHWAVGGFIVTPIMRLSVARCTRVSYLNHGRGERDPGEDLRLFDDLISVRPMHASPLEHQALPAHFSTGNFRGWAQLRYYVEEAFGIVSNMDKEPVPSITEAIGVGTE